MQKFTACLLLFSLLACNSPKQEPSLKLYVLDGGRINVLNARAFSETDVYAGQSFLFANPIFVIEHSKGRLIWDLGLPEAIAGMPGGMYTPDSIFHLTVEAGLSDQMKTIGLAPDSIDYIAFSHCHFDHTGNANYFSHATWLVQESEYEFATRDSLPQQAGYSPDSYSALSKVQKLDGEYDVFGDGLVKIIPTPGHTIGHQSLSLQLPSYGPVVLSGDLYHTPENRKEKRAPRFNYDVAQTRESMEKMEAFLTENGAKLIIQHNMEDYESLPKIPAYLD